MSNIDVFDLDFDSLIDGGNNPFDESTSKYETDERFYVLPKNEKGSGSAIIAFLPDANKMVIKKVVKFNLQNNVNGKKRFVSLFSPSTINMPDPFQEKWQECWDNGEIEEAKKYRRSIRYIANIKVLKDPLKPENEGKIFLYEMSQTLKDILYNALNPSEDDIALGATRKEIFNPLKGWVLMLTAKKSPNGILNYNSSMFVKKDELVPYKNAQEAVKDIKENTYSLDWFDKKENYLPYSELQKKLDWLFPNLNKNNNEETVVTVKETTKVEPEVQDGSEKNKTTKNEADALLDDLMADF